MTSTKTPTRTPTPQWCVAHATRILDAARRAPRWGVPRPWMLELRGEGVRIYESPLWDPRDRHDIDRWLACGAVLTNVRLAIRTAARTATVTFMTDPERPGLVAALSAEDVQPPAATEADQYAVVNGGRPLSPDHADILHAAAWCPGVEVRPLVHTPADYHGCKEFVVLTVDDGRTDRVRAGAVVQATNLAAAASGLTVHPAVNLARVPEFRAGLIERLMLAGFPQVLLRIGTGRRS